MGNSNRPNKLTHCVSLGSDPPLANNPGFFSVPPGTEKLYKLLQADKKFFYSFLHVIASSLTEQCSNIYENCLKTGIAKAQPGRKMLRFFRQKIVSPQANICGRNPLSSPHAFIFFLIPPFQNVGLKVLPLAERGN